MILNKENQIEYQSNIGFESKEAKISEEDLHKLWNLLQDPYKNKIGAIVREYSSNGLDSNLEAEFIKNNSVENIRKNFKFYKDVLEEEIIELKNNLFSFNNDAIHIKIDKDSTGWYWSCEDFGVGMSFKRVNKVFINYLKSTKEETNKQLGQWGIGSKSGLSYTEIVHIVTRYNGIEYYYLLRKGEKSPMLDKVYENETIERNGTLIKIYIKEADRYEFQKECINQLSYFDNVYFEGCNIDNDYKIIEGKHWKVSSISNNRYLHLCLGKVSYPIDFSILNISVITFPLALKFEIGELDVIQTREDVRYTEKTKKAILDKIELLKQEIVEIYNNQNFEIDDIFDYKKKCNEDKHILINNQIYNLRLLNIKFILLKDYIYSPLKDFKYSIPSNFFFEYERTYKIGRAGKLLNIESYYRSPDIGNQKQWFRNDDRFEVKKSKYISNKHYSPYVISKRKKIKLKEYSQLLKLSWDKTSNSNISDWNKAIKQYQEAAKIEFEKYTYSYKDYVVPEEVYAKTPRTRISKDLILTYKLNAWGFNNRLELKLDTIGNKCVVVGTNDQKEELENLSDIFRNIKDKHKLILKTAKSNLKLFKDLNNVWTVEKIMSNECKAFSRAITATLLNKEFLVKYNNIFDYISFEDVNNNINKDFYKIKKYINNHCLIKNNFTKQCIEIAKEKDLLDKDILDIADKIKEYFKGLELIKYINQETPVLEVVNYIRMYNKTIKDPRKKKKLNAYYYCNFNQEELKWLKDNKQEYEFQISKQVA